MVARLVWCGTVERLMKDHPHEMPLLFLTLSLPENLHCSFLVPAKNCLKERFRELGNIYSEIFLNIKMHKKLDFK